MKQNTIFQKLRNRIEKRRFNKVKVGRTTMDGMILSKADWKRYQKAIPGPVIKNYPDREIMWFRGYPLKQKI